MVMLAANCVLALLLAPIAALGAIAFLAMGALATRSYTRRARALGDVVIERHVLLTDGMLRLLDGLKLATAQNLQRHFVDGYQLGFVRFSSGPGPEDAVVRDVVQGLVEGQDASAHVVDIFPPSPM
jgi:uncharacterized SAM-binding protein YcdF (DUF218 family)